MPARRILILTYYYPPQPLIGAARWAAMSEWLRRAGHEVTVITSRFGAPPGAAEPWVLRTVDANAVSSARALLRRGPVPQPGTRALARKPAPRWFTDVVVPDECLLTWGLGALARTRQILMRRTIDCVITTGPPHSTHVLPLLMGRCRPAWIADLRDGWRFEPMRSSWPIALQDRLDRGLEQRALRTADCVIGVTRPIALDAQSRLDARALYIPNGWDPARRQGPAGSRTDTSVRLDRDRINVVHTGTISGGRGRDARPVFAALRLLAAAHPTAAERIRIVLAGSLSPDEQRMLSELDLPVPVRHVGSLTRDASLRLQREADVLLLLTSPTHVSEATGKLFEYLASERPILALASGNEAARIVTETGTGVTVHPQDVPGIVGALEAAIDGTLSRSYSPHDLGRYVYPRPAEDVAAAVEQAIARHGSAAKADLARDAGPRVSETSG